MNYIELINNFWQKDMEFNFSEREVALYFYLLKVSNGLVWKNPFGQSNAMITAKFGWGKSSFDTAKNKLKTAGLIDFKAGDGRGIVYQYEIKGLKKVAQKSTLSDNLSNTLSDNLYNPKPDTSININKNKTEESVAKATVPKSNLKETLPTRKQEFYDQVAEFKDLYQKELLRKFFDYWTELNPSGTKMKFELQKTWELSKRLTTWTSREKDFAKTPAGSTEQITTESKMLS